MPADVQKKIGINVRVARSAAKLTQEELAERVGIHADSISLIERGRTLPAVTTLMSISEALEIPLGSIIPAKIANAEMSTKRARLEAEIQTLTRALPEQHLELARDQIATLNFHLAASTPSKR